MDSINDYYNNKVDSSSDSFAMGDFFRKQESTPTFSL